MIRIDDDIRSINQMARSEIRANAILTAPFPKIGLKKDINL
jgi:hypothetical protein